MIASSKFVTILLPTAVAIAGIVYWLYKKFREAAYQPGMVAKLLEDDPALFDNPGLYSKSTDSTWTMPNGIEIYHFPVKAATSSSKTPSPILALHGGPSIAPPKPWKLCEEFPDSMHLYHARGCGKSSRPFFKFPTPGKMWPGMKTLEETLGIAAQVADMERIRRRLLSGSNEADEPIDIVGHSFGGFIATMYSAEFPERVRSLTLLVPAAVLELPSTEAGLFDTVEAKLKEQGNAEHLEEYKQFMKRYLDFGSLPNETDETLAMRQNEFAVHYFRAERPGEGESEKLDPALTGGMACYATFLSMGMEHDYIPVCAERLAKSTFPVSIVHGAKDMVPVSTSQKYMQLFPKENVKFYTVEEAGHFLIEHPEVVDITNETIQRASD